MVGGGGRKDDSLVINSTNVFAALGTLRKKKKSDKESSSSASKKGSSKKQEKEPEPQVFWAPTPLNTKSWADVDDDDDDDYYATTAPPPSVWGASAAPAEGKAKEGPTPIEDNSEIAQNIQNVHHEESESEEEGIDEVDDDVDEEQEQEHEPELPVEQEPVSKKPAEAPLPPKDTERQLSKKELKKKGLEELDAVLAELGLNTNSGQDESREPPLALPGSELEKKAENGEAEKKDSTAGEGKSTKKKKKKDKSAKEAKDPQGQPDVQDVGNGTMEIAETEKGEDISSVDVKERLKKMASIKKKKSSKEMDAAAKAAASEAAARSLRLAAAKKKEKNHYNQQPVRFHSPLK
ncbi:hypothetical protein RJ641_026113 [Dillenia turbinata]|uniref:Uncharacterized protein n=1 Tax=Dillenia turbinata TaxID=194707 RepID=A0AAN8WBR9_9MAGN